MSEEWGPWIEHDQSGCAVGNGVTVEIESRYESGTLDVVIVTMGCDYSNYNWTMADLMARRIKRRSGRILGILRYRIRKTPAQSQQFEVLREIAAGNRSPDAEPQTTPQEYWA